MKNTSGVKVGDLIENVRNPDNHIVARSDLNFIGEIVSVDSEHYFSVKVIKSDNDNDLALGSMKIECYDFEIIKQTGGDKMNTGSIIINGKETKLTDEQIRSIAGSLDIQLDVLQWRPNKREKYYYIHSDGSVRHQNWDQSIYDLGRLKIGNAFKTLDIARKHEEDSLEKISQKFIQIKNYVENNPDGWEADWNDEHQNKYYLSYSSDSKKWYREFCRTQRLCQEYMSSQMADKILAMLNEGE